MNNELVLFIVSILPICLIGFYIYKKDKDKEPSKLLIKLFLGGIASTIITLIITFILETIFPFFSLDYENLNLIQLLISVFIGVALVEEFSKWLMVYIIAYKNKAFDELYDMVLYATFVALGFACFENLLYVFENGFATGVLRAVLAVPGHAFDGVLMGYYLGLSKINEINNRKDLKRKNLVLSILVPTITHGIYDYCLFSNNLIFLLLFFVFLIGMYIYIIKKVKKISALNGKISSINKSNKYCSNCGHIIDGNYCSVCGRKNE